MANPAVDTCVATFVHCICPLVPRICLDRTFPPPYCMFISLFPRLSLLALSLLAFSPSSLSLPSFSLPSVFLLSLSFLAPLSSLPPSLPSLVPPKVHLPRVAGAPRHARPRRPPTRRDHRGRRRGRATGGPQAPLRGRGGAARAGRGRDRGNAEIPPHHVGVRGAGARARGVGRGVRPGRPPREDRCRGCGEVPCSELRPCFEGRRY